MNRINFCITIFIVFLLYTSLFGQPDTRHETVTVIGAYMPELYKASKIGFAPDITDTIAVPVLKTDYKIISRPVELDFTVKPIPPARTEGETFQQIYKNYISAGFGNYRSPYLDYSYHSIRNKKFRGKIHFKHLSAAGEFKDYKYPAYSENNAGLSGHFIQNNYTFFSKLDYNRDVIHYYGFTEHVSKYKKENILQTFNRFDFLLSAGSNHTEKDRSVNLFSLKYQGLWDRYNMNEQNVLLDGNIKKNTNIIPFFQNEVFCLDLFGGFYGQNYALQNISTGLLKAKPQFNFLMDALELTFGGTFGVLLDTVGDVLMLPYGRLDLHIVPNSFRFFILMDGDVERNTFNSLSETNPFINTEILPLDFTVSKSFFSVGGGVIGGFGNRVNYRLMAKNRVTENLPLFINDTLPFVINETDTITRGNRFTVIHDNVDIFTVSVEMQMQLSKKLNIELFAEYNNFSPEKQSKAWHLPQYKGNLKTIYNINDKILVKLNLFAFGKRYALLYKPEDAELKAVTEELKPVFDFNLELEYLYTKYLSFWLKFNNFTTKRHYYWNNYPTQRLNIMVGASYIF